jgi:hypothetical protein
MIQYHFLGVPEGPFDLVILRFPVGRFIWVGFLLVPFLCPNKEKTLASGRNPAQLIQLNQEVARQQANPDTQINNYPPAT